tara:strand:- start:50 stop:439 length:390 start_codon:yes stop_codon:yes gene_type:complete
MGVPDTNTFTLQNVVDFIDNDDNLVGCFNDAVSDDFDPNYSNTKTKLNNFRNYGAFLSFLISSTAKDPCSLTPATTVWHNGSSSYPVVGDTIYSDFGSTTITPSGNRKGADGFKYGINASGVVVTKALC